MASAGVAELVDRLLPEPALVFGSLPPAGRDLDLLVRPGAAAVSTALAAEGFRARGCEHARFRDRRVDVVELVPAASWGLPQAEVDRLFADAVPLDGLRRLVRPSPADDLLVLARRIPDWTVLDQRRRERVARALAYDPGAWAVAAERAGDWGVARGLDALRRAYDTGAPIARRRRTAAALELARSEHESVRTAVAAAVRAAAPIRTHGAVIALTGLDGSGKSTHAEALAATLRELGEDPVVEWTRIAFDEGLEAVARPVKALLGLVARTRPPAATEPAGADYWPDRSLDPVEVTARSLRSRNRVVHAVWTSVVAATNAISQRRSTRRHTQGGRLVVRDRYVLDSIVHLEEDYGRVHGVGFQARIVRWLSPTPLVAFWLDVSAEEANRRKPEDFDVPKLAARRELYERLHRPLGVMRIDTEQPADEVWATLAWEVWRRLG